MTSAITLGSVVGEWSLDGCAVTETAHAPALRLAPHDHDVANLTIVLSGGFEERVGSRTVACEPGTLLLKPSGAHHSNHYGDATVHCVTVSFPAAPQLLIATRRPSFAADAQRLRIELRRGDRFAAEAVAFTILGEATRARDETRRPLWIDEVEERLHTDERVSVAALARAVGRHPSHMAREFRRHTSVTLGEYARDARLVRACAALRSEKPITDIALECGFADQSHFTNAFRRRFGITPARFRAQDLFKTRAARRR